MGGDSSTPITPAPSSSPAAESLHLKALAAGLLLLTGAFLTAAGGLFADTSKRFLSPNTDALALGVFIIQAVVTVVSGGWLLKTGADLLSQMKLPPLRRSTWLMIVAFATFAGALLLNALGLPMIARTCYFPPYGIAQPAVASGQAPAAEHAGRACTLRWPWQAQAPFTLDQIQTAYQQAIQLDPTFLAAHYRLGLIYSDEGDFDKAVAELQTADRLAQAGLPSNGVGKNQIVTNLTFLMLWRASQPWEFSYALQRIDAELGTLAPLSETHDVALARYMLDVNRGWAHLGLKDYRDAESDVREALSHEPAGVGAHCIWAQVANATHDNGARGTESAKCLGEPLASEAQPEDWTAFARQYGGL